MSPAATMVPADFAGYSFVGLEFFEVPVLGPDGHSWQRLR